MYGPSARTKKHGRFREAVVVKWAVAVSAVSTVGSYPQNVGDGVTCIPLISYVHDFLLRTLFRILLFSYFWWCGSLSHHCGF